jgi:general stress protein YciG
MNMAKDKRGWYGDPVGHARAGRLGGKASTGKFQKGSERAREAGRKGGSRKTSTA